MKNLLALDCSAYNVGDTTGLELASAGDAVEARFEGFGSIGLRFSGVLNRSA